MSEIIINYLLVIKYIFSNCSDELILEFKDQWNSKDWSIGVN